VKSSLSPEVIQTLIKSAFKIDAKENSKVWGLCKSLGSQINAEIRVALAEQAKEAKATSAGATYPDDFKGFTPEQRSEEVAKLLDYKLYTKELTASELRELKDIFNLKAKDQDVIIEQVDFRSIEPELADIVAGVNWQINEYNSKAGE
jgi:hypothetical protein